VKNLIRLLAEVITLLGNPRWAGTAGSSDRRGAKVMQFPAIASEDPSLLPGIREFGVFNARGCFACGSCTLVCDLCEGSASFPRRSMQSVLQAGRFLNSPDTHFQSATRTSGTSRHRGPRARVPDHEAARGDLAGALRCSEARHHAGRRMDRLPLLQNLSGATGCSFTCRKAER
jgi:hypothetical protein